MRARTGARSVIARITNASFGFEGTGVSEAESARFEHPPQAQDECCSTHGNRQDSQSRVMLARKRASDPKARGDENGPCDEKAGGRSVGDGLVLGLARTREAEDDVNEA